MRSNTGDHVSAQAQATIDEYASQVRDGNTVRQENIRHANPELVKQFDVVDRNTLATL